LKTHHSLFAEDEVEHPPPTWSKRRGVLTLMVSAILVFVESEMVVNSVQTAARKLGMSEVFIGIIVVAIVGNAAEHASAVWMAYKGRIDICVNVAIGSCAQIALFVAPLLVLTSLGLRHPMDLVFSPHELIAVIVAVAAAHFVVLDGKTNWFEGVELMAVYFILAVGFYVLPAAPPALAGAVATSGVNRSSASLSTEGSRVPGVVISGDRRR